MDFVCCVLKQYYLINEKEEENMKKKIKECLKFSKSGMIKILYHEADLSEVYKEMKTAHFGHLIAFYCLLETYDEIIQNKTKEEKKDFTVQLTLQSLDDFQKYKKNRLQEIPFNFFYSTLFYTGIKTGIARCIVSSIGQTLTGIFN